MAKQCSRMHTYITAGQWMFEGRLWCTRHLNRRVLELALRELAGRNREDPQCPDHPGRTQRPRYKAGVKAYRVWCWGEYSVQVLCYWEHKITAEALEERRAALQTEAMPITD